MRLSINLYGRQLTLHVLGRAFSVFNFPAPKNRGGEPWYRAMWSRLFWNTANLRVRFWPWTFMTWKA